MARKRTILPIGQFVHTLSMTNNVILHIFYILHGPSTGFVTSRTGTYLVGMEKRRFRQISTNIPETRFQGEKKVSRGAPFFSPARASISFKCILRPRRLIHIIIHYVLLQSDSQCPTSFFTLGNKT